MMIGLRVEVLAGLRHGSAGPSTLKGRYGGGVVECFDENDGTFKVCGGQGGGEGKGGFGFGGNTGAGGEGGGAGKGGGSF